jgi:hypothetical protein
MNDRRRNLTVLGVVAALVAVCIMVILPGGPLEKKTQLGLDLRGGVELIYQAEPTPQVPKVTPQAVSDAINTIRKRTNALGVSESEVQQQGRDQVDIGLPGVANAARAEQQVGNNRTAPVLRLGAEHNRPRRQAIWRASRRHRGGLCRSQHPVAKPARCRQARCQGQAPSRGKRHPRDRYRRQGAAGCRSRSEERPGRPPLLRPEERHQRQEVLPLQRERPAAAGPRVHL